MYPSAIFINTNNTVYVPDARNNRIVIWSEGNNTPTENISVGPLQPDEIFVTTSGDIYIETSNGNLCVVRKWTLTSTTGTPIMYTCQICSALFVDISDTLYCSISSLNQVVTQSLNSGSNTLTIIADTGTAGSTFTLLDGPQGIFVDINFDLYVADSGNNRIQLFRPGQLNATTVAGSGSSSNTFPLNYPTSIVLDADKYLFIVDYSNNRIVGSGPTGFRCIVGCSGSLGTAANQLFYPKNMAFDSYGNIFVTDMYNYRIQKFILMTNLCGKYN
jgi:sugar lactone lactonase YvrE